MNFDYEIELRKAVARAKDEERASVLEELAEATELEAEWLIEQLQNTIAWDAPEVRPGRILSAYQSLLKGRSRGN